MVAEIDGDDVELTASRGGALRAAVVVVVSCLVALLVPGVAGDGPPSGTTGIGDVTVAAPQAPAVPPGTGIQAPTVDPGARAPDVGSAGIGAVAPVTGQPTGPGAPVTPVPPVGPAPPGDTGAGDVDLGGDVPDVADPDRCGLPEGVALFGRPPSCDELAGWEVCLLPNGVVIFSPVRCWELEAPGVPCAVNDLVAYGAADCFGLDFSVGTGLWTGPWERGGDGAWTSTAAPAGAADGGASAASRSIAAFDRSPDGRTSRLTPTGWSPDARAASWTAVATWSGPGFRWRGPVTWWTGPRDAGGVSTWRWTAPASWTAAPSVDGPATYAYVHVDAGVWEVGGPAADDGDAICELRVGWTVPGDCEQLGIPACAVVGATGRCDGWLTDDAADGVLGIDNPSGAAAAAAGAVASGGAPTGDSGASTDVDPGTAADARAAGLGRATAAVDDEVEIAVAASATASADGLVVAADLDETLAVDPRAQAVLVELYAEVAALARLGDEVVTVSSRVVVQRVGVDVLLTVASTITVGRDGTPVQIVDQRSFTAADPSTSLRIDGPLLPTDLLAGGEPDPALAQDTTWAAIRATVGDHLARIRAVVDGGPVGVGASREGLRTLDESGEGVPLAPGSARNEAQSEVDLATAADSNATGAAAAAAAGSVAGANADLDGSTSTTESLATSTEALVEHDGIVTGEASSTGATLGQLYDGLDEVEAVDPASGGTTSASATGTADAAATADDGTGTATGEATDCATAGDVPGAVGTPATTTTTAAEPVDEPAGATGSDDTTTAACDTATGTAAAAPTVDAPADGSTEQVVVDTVPDGSTEPEEDPLQPAAQPPDDDGEDPTPPPEPPSDEADGSSTAPTP